MGFLPENLLVEVKVGVIMGLDKDKSCWNCKYQDVTTPVFLGTCTWFSKHKKGKDKDIPPEVVDEGCKLFQSKTRDK